MRVSPRPEDNIAAALQALTTASKQRVDLCILPELFANRYVGQFPDSKAQRRHLPNHQKLLADFQEASKKTRTAAMVPFAEVIEGDRCYNSLVLVDQSGKVRAKYRKTHIPDSVGYREDLYFRPGDLGYVVVRLGPVKIGLGICWDQWFPEASRALALQGADLIVYPSAIGSEIVRPDFDSRPEWELVMRAQAIMNRVFVAAVNRVGQEERIRFYGGSFVADPWGNIIKRASLNRPEIVFADLDLSQIREARSFFGFLDTRRPETYGALTRASRAKPRNQGGAT